MNKLVKINQEVEHTSQKWDAEAIESLQSIERYTVLKAIEEGKKLSKKVMTLAAQKANGQTVTKSIVQDAMVEIFEELELSKTVKQ